jgi:hypothetical protein
MTDRQNPYAGDHCSDQEHTLHRRKFLQGMGTGIGASMFSWSGLLTPSVFAEIAKKQQKNCILLWLCGAPSQFETWDPKPGRITSGPFGSIPTKIPGVHFSELMPQCATIADKLVYDPLDENRAYRTFSGYRSIDSWRCPSPSLHTPRSWQCAWATTWST